jgi:hypothetical protein
MSHNPVGLHDLLTGIALPLPVIFYIRDSDPNSVAYAESFSA